MLLTIDAGNTNITLGVFDGNNLTSTFRITTKEKRTSDEFKILIFNLLQSEHIDPHDIIEVIVSSVVPNIMHSLVNSIKKLFKVMPLIIGPGIKTGIAINAENPKEVGADRIVNVTAAYNKYKRACLIIDFGTATTFDYVSDKGVFEYTVITPGLEIAGNALSNNAAKLPAIEIKFPSTILTKNTISGMQAGLMYGYLGQVEYIVRKMKKEINNEMIVIATGGLGREIAKNTDCINVYEKNLAFHGMKIIFDKTKEAQKQ